MAELDQAAVLTQTEALTAEDTEAMSWKAALPAMAALSVLGIATTFAFLLEFQQLVGF
jgi:hypothetical protein